MNYCSHCGSTVEFKIPPGDNLPRYVCGRCGQIHYQNPKIVTGCIPEWEDKILLCKRAIEPRRGLWTLPAGFMENKETTSEAAVRETMEEANATVEPIGLYALFNIPHISQVYIMFRARMLNTDYGPGAESLEVELFDERKIPWEEIAFPVIKETLIRYYRDKSNGVFSLHVDDINPSLTAKR
ncbi:MAG: ADP-ribose pyrophosphatase [Gammaproteobacteria bacterium SG8_11]|nr:MAG: ADP-ribose pyrophosphatase [Gammaproteobacteria bacterium SG8_11]